MMDSTLTGEVVIVSGDMISGMMQKKDFDILVIYISAPLDLYFAKWNKCFSPSLSYINQVTQGAMVCSHY